MIESPLRADMWETVPKGPGVFAGDSVSLGGGLHNQIRVVGFRLEGH